MIDKCVEEVELMILDVIGVGSFVQVGSVKKYIKKNEKMKNKVIKLLDCYHPSNDIDEIVDIAEQSLFNKNMISRLGKRIKQSHIQFLTNPEQQK